MLGTFKERPDDEHIALRSSLLGERRNAPLPDPVLEILGQNLSNNLSIVNASLAAHGFAVIRLDKPLDISQFVEFGEKLGMPLDELDPATQDFRLHEKVVDIRNDSEVAESASLEPFSSFWLAVHSERSQQPLENQPKLIVLMCVEGDDQGGQTLLIDMESVVSRMSEQAKEILQQTRYDREGTIPFLRHENGRWIISILDFQNRGFAWSCDCDCSPELVNSSIRELFTEIYRESSTKVISWCKGLVVVIDNSRMLHGRTRSAPSAKRSLWRLRLLTTSPQLFGYINLQQNKYNLINGPKEEPTGTNLGAKSASPELKFFDQRLLDVFDCAKDPTDPFELRDLWLGKMECGLSQGRVFDDLVSRANRAKPRRRTTPEEIFRSQAYVRMVKELSNTFFRDELYGMFRSEKNNMLSTGTALEQHYGLGVILKEALHYSVDRDWYGYSDTRGLFSARNSIASYESTRLNNHAAYNLENVVLTMGATHAVSSLADFILGRCSSKNPAIVGIPNYAPMVEAIARRHEIQLVSTPVTSGKTDLVKLRNAISDKTPLAFFQTATNPTGTAVDEEDLAMLIRATDPSTTVVLDESHEWLGAPRKFCPERANKNVIRIRSLSKEWSAPGLRIGWFMADRDFVRDFYEYASSSYGCPPSINYTLLVLLATFEEWILRNKLNISQADVASLSSDYSLSLDRLRSAFFLYWTERRSMRNRLIQARNLVVRSLREKGIEVISPECSINLIFKHSDTSDSYQAYRELLFENDVALFPTALTFVMGGSWLRLTYGMPINELKKGLFHLTAAIQKK